MSSEQNETLEKKVDKIIGYLHNDHGTGTKGLVADFAEHKQSFHDFKTKYEQEQAIKKRDTYWLSAIFGLIGSGLMFLGQYFFNRWNKGS